MKAERRALLRLYAVQTAWNYERMLGIGMANAAEPLLESIADAGARRAAMGRATEFFNSHPFLAGLALGATARAELDGEPGERIQRLRAALCGPLGSLGDQLFWTGVLPFLSGTTIMAVLLTGSVWPVAAFVIVINVLRAYVARWALHTGLANGLAIGKAIAASRLRSAAAVAVPASALAVGAAVPLAMQTFLHTFASRSVAGAIALVVAGILASRLAGPRYAAPRFTLIAMAVAILYHWILP